MINSKSIIASLLFLSITTDLFAQLDFNLMENWAFHPAKKGTLIDGFNLDIAVIDKNLDTDTIFRIPNNSMIDTGVDVFFVHPTLLPDLEAYSTRENLPLGEQSSWLVSASIIGQAGLLAKYGRFFAPRYRQATPPTYIGSPSDSIQAAVIGEAYKDIKTAFMHYLKNYNHGNKIILASHSQGAYLAAMLLKEVFDNDISLQNKLVTAVVAGVACMYANPYQFTGGWWQNLPLCTKMDQCNCVMTWRSFKDRQPLPKPPVHLSIPSRNPYLANNGLVYRLLDFNQDWFLQDSLYYSTQAKPIRYYIAPKGSKPFGGNAGFVAFENMYRIRYLRESRASVGFMVEYTPDPGDKRPNDLAEVESDPNGYHKKDYNIYSWALMEQIDMKLAACGITTGISDNPKKTKHFVAYPNPANNQITLQIDGQGVAGENISVLNMLGEVVFSGHTDYSGHIPTHGLNNGLYLIKSSYGTHKIMIQQ